MYRSSTAWIIDFRYEGRPRRWSKVVHQGLDSARQFQGEFQALYGDRAKWVGATP
jgi:hypothetical protein